jgi:hypothetical protein
LHRCAALRGCERCLLLQSLKPRFRLQQVIKIFEGGGAMCVVTLERVLQLGLPLHKHFLLRSDLG